MDSDDEWVDVANRVRNWGRWGADDELGTLNYIGAAEVAAAARLVTRGKVIPLSIPIEQYGPQGAHGFRRNPLHMMTVVGATTEVLPYLDGWGGETEAEMASLLKNGPMRLNDDYLAMHLQAGTHWDAFSHIFYNEQLYNGYGEAAVTSFGATRGSIDRVALAGRIVGRGVLLDVALHRGSDALAADAVIMPDELDEVAEAERVTILPGDIVIVRTGWWKEFLRKRDGLRWRSEGPGLNWRCAQWLHQKKASAVASDNLQVEAHTQDTSVPMVFHMLTLRDMGLMLGEIWDLEGLSADCAHDGIYEFQLIAQPLRISGAVGSPVNPLAIK